MSFKYNTWQTNAWHDRQQAAALRRANAENRPILRTNELLARSAWRKQLAGHLGRANVLSSSAGPTIMGGAS